MQKNAADKACRPARIVRGIGLSASSPEGLHQRLYLAGREGVGLGAPLGVDPQGHGAGHEHVVVASAAGGGISPSSMLFAVYGGVERDLWLSPGLL